MKRALISTIFIGSLLLPSSPSQATETPTAYSLPSKMKLIETINGNIAPKSVLASGTGLVSAHNMMYRHSVTIYDSKKNTLLATVSDTVRLSDFGYKKYSGTYKGAPVEGAFSPDGKYLYFTNYAMYGKGFNKEGTDKCSPSNGYDASFLSRVNLDDYKIDAVYSVGSVPKVVQVTPDNKYILVSNWCSYTVTVISVDSGKTAKTIKIGRYPRGIAVDKSSTYAYVAEMGGSGIHRIDLRDFSKTFIPVGSNPRAVVLSPDEKTLYVTLNVSGKVAAWDLEANKLIKTATTGKAARSLAISDDGAALYVVNYLSGTVSKVRSSDLKVVQTLRVCNEPIGITFDSSSQNTWVACYGGSIKILSN
jgi:YVTN family beta-propeller protein